MQGEPRPWVGGTRMGGRREVAWAEVLQVIKIWDHCPVFPPQLGIPHLSQEDEIGSFGLGDAPTLSHGLKAQGFIRQRTIKIAVIPLRALVPKKHLTCSLNKSPTVQGV